MPNLTAIPMNDDTPLKQCHTHHSKEASGLRDKSPYLIAFPRADAAFLNVQPGHCWVIEGSIGCIRSQAPEMT